MTLARRSCSTGDRILLDVLQDDQRIVVADIGDRVDKRQTGLPVSPPRIGHTNLAVGPKGFMVKRSPRKIDQA
jgi:hypothetical protein